MERENIKECFVIIKKLDENSIKSYNEKYHNTNFTNETTLKPVVEKIMLNKSCLCDKNVHLSNINLDKNSETFNIKKLPNLLNSNYNSFIKSNILFQNANTNEINCKNFVDDEIDSKIYNCIICPNDKNIKFRSEKLLLQHLDRHTYPFVCELCLKRFARKDSLTNHLRLCTNVPELKYLSNKEKHVPEKDQPFVNCSECGAKFYRIAPYRRHLRDHTHPLECKVCGMRFARRTTLAEHLCDPILYQCVLCTKNSRARASTHTFPTLVQLEEHLGNPETGHDLAPTKVCADCDRKFCLEASLEQHICQTLSTPNSAMFPTSLTSTSTKHFDTNLNPIVKTHSLSDHDYRLFSVTGRIYDEYFGKRNEESISLSGIQASGSNSWNITSTSTSRNVKIEFTNIEDILNSGTGAIESELIQPTYGLVSKSSVSKLKVGNLDPFICESCGQQFSSANSLKAHRIIHGEKRFKCELCGRAFHRKDTLKVHYRVHEETLIDSSSPDLILTDPLSATCMENQSAIVEGGADQATIQNYSEKYKYAKRNEFQRHACPICGKVVKSKHSLDTHLKLHRQDEEKQYPCHLCPKTFLQKGNLRKHLLTHAQQRYSCPLCHKIFSSKEYCTHHIREHTEEKKHICPECGKRFLLRFRMLDHHSRAHSSAVYACPFCELKIKMRHSLKRHLRRKHLKLSHIWDQPGYLESISSSTNNTCTSNLNISAKSNITPLRLPYTAVPAIQRSIQPTVDATSPNIMSLGGSANLLSEAIRRCFFSNPTPSPSNELSTNVSTLDVNPSLLPSHHSSPKKAKSFTRITINRSNSAGIENRGEQPTSVPVASEIPKPIQLVQLKNLLQQYEISPTPPANTISDQAMVNLFYPDSSMTGHTQSQSVMSQEGDLHNPSNINHVNNGLNRSENPNFTAASGIKMGESRLKSEFFVDGMFQYNNASVNVIEPPCTSNSDDPAALSFNLNEFLHIDHNMLNPSSSIYSPLDKSFRDHVNLFQETAPINVSNYGFMESGAPRTVTFPAFTNVDRMLNSYEVSQTENTFLAMAEDVFEEKTPFTNMRHSEDIIANYDQLFESS